MKESMLKSVRIEAGIGNSPKEYVNNDPEAPNFMVKHALNFDPKINPDFINEVKETLWKHSLEMTLAPFLGKGNMKFEKNFNILPSTINSGASLEKKEE